MENILKYENRQILYQFLVDDYGFKIKEEKDYKALGYYSDLVGNFFLLRYYNDRDVLSIDIASKADINNRYALSFIKDLIYNPDAINSDENIKGNTTRMNELNDFLRKDFDKICELFSEANYHDTKKRLDEGLRKQFFLKHPDAKA